MKRKQVKSDQRLWLLAALVAMTPVTACDGAESGPVSAVRAPLVDEASGRVEEIPETELPAPDLVAPDPTLEQAAAGREIGGILARVGEREVVREGRAEVGVALDTLSAEEARRFLELRHVAAGTTRVSLETGVAAATRSAADEVAAVVRSPRVATPGQAAALGALDSSSIDPLVYEWDAIRGTPAMIKGIFAIDRSADEYVVAEDFVQSRWDDLRDVLAADDLDAADAVDRVDLPSGLTEVAFRRSRGGIPMPENLIYVYVSNSTHMLGAGVVVAVGAQWDRDVARFSLEGALSDEQAVLLAEDALGVSVAGGDAVGGRTSSELLWKCFLRDHEQLCAPTWRVHAPRALAGEVLRAGTPGTVHDTAYVDARDGAIVVTARTAQDYTGSVNVPSATALELTSTTLCANVA